MNSFKFLPFQEKLLANQAMCKVDFSLSFTKNNELGWTINDKNLYKIAIAGDVDKSVQQIILIHELGHVEEKHNDINFKKEFVYIRHLFKVLDVNYNKILSIGGPMGFLNIAVDLYINCKYLTPANIQYMRDCGFKILDLTSFGFEYAPDFRSYYIPLINYLNKNPEDIEQDLLNDIASFAENEDFSEFKNTEDTSLTDEELNEISKAYTAKPASIQEKDMCGEPVKTAIQKFNSQISIQPEPKSITDGIDNSQKIAKMLSKIVKHDKKYMPDALKLFNRKSRNFKNGLLYTSRKRKIQKSNTKLAIILDTSGSMQIEDIMSALTSLKNLKEFMHAQTTIFQTTTHVVKTFTLNEISNTFQLNINGGTDMRAGVKDAHTRGFTHIVIYSDFDTPQLDDVFDKYPANYYGISTTNMFNKTSQKFIDGCYDYLILN